MLLCLSRVHTASSRALGDADRGTQQNEPTVRTCRKLARDRERIQAGLRPPPGQSHCQAAVFHVFHSDRKKEWGREKKERM